MLEPKCVGPLLAKCFPIHGERCCGIVRARALQIRIDHQMSLYSKYKESRLFRVGSQKSLISPRSSSSRESLHLPESLEGLYPHS